MTLDQYDTYVYSYDYIAKRSKLHLAVTLGGEIGEVLGEVDKENRPGGEDRNIKIAYELGDCLFGIAALAAKCGYNLEEIAKMNINKLDYRHGVNA